MRKILCLLLACTALLLAGCALFSASREKDFDDSLVVVGFSQVGSESDWRLANTASMVSALSEQNGYRLLFDNARQKQENQYLAIRNFIQQDVNYIVLAPISETGWDSVFREAKAAGIPVIQMAVTWMEEAFPDSGELLQILHLQGTEGATAQLMRSRALEEAVARHENWTVEAALKGEFTEAKGYEVVRDFLKTGTPFRVLYSENDNMTFGAMRALDEAGISYGKDGEIKIISFDAVRKALLLCLDGKINLCVECNPLHGPRVDRLIKSCEAREDVPKSSYVEEICFTCDTITPQMIDEREY